MSELEKNIIATLRFYDFFERPLSSYEIYKYLLQLETTAKPASLKKVLQTLKDSAKLNQEIKAFGGFYFLKEGARLVSERIKKEKNSIAKWRKAKKIAKILQIVPFTKMIAISGSLALSNTKPQSDLDFFIVAKTSRIWLCRLFTSFLTQVLGLRRHAEKIKDRACLNSFITDNTLKIKTRDLYSASEYLHLVPLWGVNIYQSFKKSNSWIGSYFLHSDRLKTANQRLIQNGFLTKLFKHTIELTLNNQTGNWFEQLAAKYQKRKILKNPKTGWQNSQIIFGDDCLIFHPAPKAPLIEKIMQPDA